MLQLLKLYFKKILKSVQMFVFIHNNDRAIYSFFTLGFISLIHPVQVLPFCNFKFLPLFYYYHLSSLVSRLLSQKKNRST